MMNKKRSHDKVAEKLSEEVMKAVARYINHTSAKDVELSITNELGTLSVRIKVELKDYVDV